ncbi:MAG: C25 family cysteine peptidase, partial [Bacteroidota bacterium]
MTKKITLLSLCFLSIVSAYAQNIELVSDKGNTVTLISGGYYLSPRTEVVNGITYHKFSKDFTCLMEKGAPALPVERASVMVANNGNVTVDVSYDHYDEYQGMEILPSKGSLKRNVKPSDVLYEFGAAYNQDAFYPGTLAEAGSPYILRDTRGVTVSVYPYQYNPVTKVLRIYYDITVKVITAGNGGNQKSGSVIGANSAFSKIYANHYINARTANLGDEEPLAPEMLIVAPDTYVTHLTALANWKVESGIKTIITPLSEVGSTPEGIKAYIQEYYAENPGLVYVLLAGDHQNLPSYSYGISGGGEALWSDTYYAQLEGDDFYPEVLIGRFSGTTYDVDNMVSRTLEYETAPLEGDWMTRVVGIGSNEGDGYGDDGEPDWQHLRNIGNKLLANGYTYAYEFFDGSHGENDGEESPANYMISDAVNDGVGLINYTGHGATNEFSTGAYTNTHVYGLTNAGMYPFVVSVACNNGTFTTGTSICEAWLTTQNQGVPTGAIAACGSSILMAWAEPMQTQDEMTELIIRTNPDVKKYALGDLFYSGQLSMLQTYNESATAIEIMQTWVFFGDPSVTYRNA